MNPLQLSQILPQSTQNTNLAFAQKNSDASFADALKAAQSELDSRESQKQAENSKTTEISRQSESESQSKIAESGGYEKKPSESSKNPAKISDERNSDRKISEDKKSENKIAKSDGENQDEKSKKSDEKEIALGEKNAGENLPLENAAENLLSSNKEN